MRLALSLPSSQRHAKEFLPVPTDPPPHAQTALQTARKQRPKVHFPCLFLNWQLNSSSLNPSAQGELGHSLNPQWEMTGEFAEGVRNLPSVCLAVSGWFLGTRPAEGQEGRTGSAHHPSCDLLRAVNFHPTVLHPAQSPAFIKIFLMLALQCQQKSFWLDKPGQTDRAMQQEATLGKMESFLSSENWITWCENGKP